MRLVIAKPGIPLGRCAIASGSRIACGQRVIAFCALRAAFSSAVLNPFPLNCSSERMMFAPKAPFGKAASSSCVNLAIIASIFAAEIRPLRCLRCFAASSGASGAKATRMVSPAAICLIKLFFMFLSSQALLHHAKARNVYHRLGLYPETAQPGSRKRVVCYSILVLSHQPCYRLHRHRIACR